MSEVLQKDKGLKVDMLTQCFLCYESLENNGNSLVVHREVGLEVMWTSRLSYVF